MFRVPRSRGALSGLLLILLGIWGGLIPLVGPYLHYAYTPAKAWTITSGRAWFEFAPAAVAILGGLMLLASRFRPWALLGACLAAASGGWFVLGNVIARLWTRTPPTLGAPVGGSVARIAEQIGFFAGLGAVIIFVAAVAIGRVCVISVRDAKLAESAADADRKSVAAQTSEAVPSGIDFTTTPATRSGAGAMAPQTTSPTARKTPMAALTRIASRNKPAQHSADEDSYSEASSRSGEVSSGAGRR